MICNWKFYRSGLSSVPGNGKVFYNFGNFLRDQVIFFVINIWRWFVGDNHLVIHIWWYIFCDKYLVIICWWYSFGDKYLVIFCDKYSVINIWWYWVINRWQLLKRPCDYFTVASFLLKSECISATCRIYPKPKLVGVYFTLPHQSLGNRSKYAIFIHFHFGNFVNRSSWSSVEKITNIIYLI